jgi:GT2 family glycosyltransferase
VSARLDPVALNEDWVRKSRDFPAMSELTRTPHPPYLYYLSGCLIGVRRSAHDAIGGFDESLTFMQDSDYSMRLQLNGAVPIFLPEAVVHYRARSTMHGIFSQALSWGEASALLQRKYDDGRPVIENRARWAIKGWKPVLLSLPSVYHRAGRARFLWNVGWQVGRLYGSARHRVLAI